jgi:hypothetical protein
VVAVGHQQRVEALDEPSSSVSSQPPSGAAPALLDLVSKRMRSRKPKCST